MNGGVDFDNPVRVVSLGQRRGDLETPLAPRGMFFADTSKRHGYLLGVMVSQREFLGLFAFEVLFPEYDRFLGNHGLPRRSGLTTGRCLPAQSNREGGAQNRTDQLF